MLADKFKVFLDSKSIKLGGDWDKALSIAQQSALVTVVLISASTDDAYYQREEIATAVAGARSERGHCVVPVYLSKDASKSENIPYGLRLKHSVTLSNDFSISDLALRLTELLRELTSSASTETLVREFDHTVQCPMCRLSEVERYESINVNQFEGVYAG